MSLRGTCENRRICEWIIIKKKGHAESCTVFNQRRSEESWSDMKSIYFCCWDKADISEYWAWFHRMIFAHFWFISLSFSTWVWLIHHNALSLIRSLTYLTLFYNGTSTYLFKFVAFIFAIGQSLHLHESQQSKCSSVHAPHHCHGVSQHRLHHQNISRPRLHHQHCNTTPQPWMSPRRGCVGASGCGNRRFSRWPYCRLDHFLLYISEKQKSEFDGNERNWVMMQAVL